MKCGQVPPQLLRAQVREIRGAGKEREHLGIAQIGGARVGRAGREVRGKRREMRRVCRDHGGRRDRRWRCLPHRDRPVLVREGYAGGR